MILGRGGGGGDSEGLGRMMVSLPLQLGGDMPGIGVGGIGLQAQQRKGEETSGKGMGGMAMGGVGNPQWGHQETRDLIAIRAALERDSTVSKRNKTLWEAVAARMRERGYRRTPEQCKCKWKNLVNRYKGKETSDPEHGRQCPFFDELHAVFAERAKNMQRHLLESESGGPQGKKKLKRPSGDRSSEDLSDDDAEDDDDSEEDHTSKGKKKRSDRGQPQRPGDKSKSTGNIHELLLEFIQQQQRMEAQWQEMMERRTQERRLFEQEWRQSMEKLERERLMMEQSWREREEQRRMREEARAEKREALLTTLLNKLIHDGL